MRFRKRRTSYLATNLSSVLGVVLIWRGIWYVFDEIDRAVFGGSHLATAVGGILLGLLILYVPKRNLQALEHH
jgi:hypothetical protein